MRAPKTVFDGRLGKTYNVLRLLKRTGFSTVYLVADASGQEFACKTVSKLALQKQKHFELFEAEIAILRQMKHKNVLPARGIFKDLDNYYILTDYCADGSLFDLVQARKRLTEEEIYCIVFQLLQALQYLQRQRVIHRDMKPQNALLRRIFPGDDDVNQELRVCLIDFGLATQYAKSAAELKRFTFCGSPCIIAPEVLASYVLARLKDKMQVDESIDAECIEMVKLVSERQALFKDKYPKYDAINNGYKYEVDMWGLGCTMYFLMYGQMPFSAGRDSLVYQKALRGDYLINTNLNPQLSQDCIDFMTKLLAPNKNDRFTLEQALEADWISHGAMVKMKFLPHECVRPEFDPATFYAYYPDIFQFKETLSQRLALQRANKIYKPIYLPTLDITDAVKGLGLLKIRAKTTKMGSKVYPFQHRISIIQYLVTNFNSFVFGGVECKLANPVKFPPVIFENKLFHKRQFDEFLNTLDNITRRCLQNYQIYRSDIVRNAYIENELTNLPNVVFSPQMVVAASNSEKYGNTYLFRDGSVSCCFKDGSVLIVSPNDVYVDFYSVPPKRTKPAMRLPADYRFYFRMKSQFFAQFFDEKKYQITKYFKEQLKEYMRYEDIISKRDSGENLYNCEVSSTDSDESVAIQQYYSFVLQIPQENSATLDLFLAPFIDLLYDEKCRYFCDKLSDEQISEFSAARYRTLTAGKQDLSINDYKIDYDVPNLMVLSEQKVLNLVLQDIISDLLENEQAFFGSDTLISHIAAAIDLNHICLDALQRPLITVNSYVQQSDVLAFRLSNGEFQIDFPDANVLIGQKYVTFYNENGASVSYPAYYFDSVDFRFQFGRERIHRAIDISAEYGI